MGNYDGANSLNFEIKNFNSTLHDGNYSLTASNEFGSVETLSINLSPFTSYNKTFGGSENEYLADLLEITDNGFLLIGTSDSNGTGDQSEAKSRIGKDFWIVRTNASGENCGIKDWVGMVMTFLHKWNCFGRRLSASWIYHIQGYG